MQSFSGKVALVTGAASGIGFALARRWAAEGMRLAVADWDEASLQDAADRLRAGGAEVLAVHTDVSDEQSVARLADAVDDAYGGVQVLCNNAAILGPSAGLLWELPRSDWERVFAVNIFGVIHGLRVFVPRMLAQDAECHIVNTASMGSLTAQARIMPYIASKHAVMAVSESLSLQLRAQGARIGVSVLCPGPTDTSIVQNELKRTGAPPVVDEAAASPVVIAEIMDPNDTASVLVEAVRRDQLYVFPNPGSRERIVERYDAVLSVFRDGDG